MTSWIEPPPRQKGMGCFGKGCLTIGIFLVLLIAAFFIGGYAGVRYVVTSTEPRELPKAEVSEAEQQSVKNRWEEFKANGQNPPPETVIANAPPDAPVPTPSANRIELTASDINQLIAGNRKTSGKAFVSIENNVAHVQVSIPLEKVGFNGRYLNGEFTVRSSPDRNPRNLQVTQMSLGGMPEGVLKALLGTKSLHSYLDEFATQYAVTSLVIEDNKVSMETSRAVR